MARHKKSARVSSDPPAELKNGAAKPVDDDGRMHDDGAPMHVAAA